MENGQVVELHKKGRPYEWAGCTKFGKSINGQGTIRVSRVAKFSEMNKWACPFIRQVRVFAFENCQLKQSADLLF